MGSIRTFGPVKLFIGVLASEEAHLQRLESRLSEEYGPIDLRSPVIPFISTDYYQHETGDHIVRVFFSFERLIDGDRLPEIKCWTNELESEFAASAGAAVKRPVNLDPGYVENAKVILASTKNFYHRMYIGRGIFAEVTMHYRNHACEFFPWTYPDYQSEDYQRFFLEVRRMYREQLKSMCLLKQEKISVRDHNHTE
jgi:hypothetical protein